MKIPHKSSFFAILKKSEYDKQQSMVRNFPDIFFMQVNPAENRFRSAKIERSGIFCTWDGCLQEKDKMESKGKILLTDDEADFTEFVKWQLEMLSYSVETASCGSRALEILQNKENDVLLADIRMPGMDGIELIRKALVLQPDIQCIVLTGHGGIDTAVKAMRLGAGDYLRKPLGVDELEIAIRKAMEKLSLIRSVREKQDSLEKANAELTRLRHQLEESLKTESAGRFAAEEELKSIRLREILVEIMAFSLRCWKQSTKKTKIDLAEESKIWTASLDSGGTYRTRTLDRYLRLSTLPPNPRSGDVLDTAYFVLSHCPLDTETKKHLEEKIAVLEKLLLKSS